MPQRSQTELDHAGFRITNLGDPKQSGDATKTDNDTIPVAAFGMGRPGNSFLAAPADHIHPSTGAALQLNADGMTVGGTTESLIFQSFVDFQPIYSGTLVPVFTALMSVTLGDCDFFVRLGGEVDVPDGNIISALTTDSTRPVPKIDIGDAVPTPGEPTLVKVTGSARRSDATARISSIRIVMSG